MIDLTTSYLGLTLKNPLVVSSNPLCAEVESLRQLEAAGAGAVVLPSLFEEQLLVEDLGMQYYLNQGLKELPPALHHIPDMQEYNSGADGYLTLIYQAKQALSIPVIASLNGVSSGGWVRYARLLEAAGADALELNVYYLPTELGVTASAIETMYLRLVESVKGSVTIPVAVKLSPYFSAIPNIAHQLATAGADGLVLFNRFYQPDFDLEVEAATPNLQLSSPTELRLRLRWVAILYQRLTCSLAITGGVHSSQDVLKGLMAGADVVMVASALLQHGPTYVTTLLKGVQQWLEQRHYRSVADIRGRLSPRGKGDIAAFERANYLQVLRSYRG